MGDYDKELDEFDAIHTKISAKPAVIAAAMAFLRAIEPEAKLALYGLIDVGAAAIPGGPLVAALVKIGGKAILNAGDAYVKGSV